MRQLLSRSIVPLALLLVAAQVLPASSVSDKTYGPPIELTGSDRCTDIFDLGQGDRIIQYNNPDKPEGKGVPSRVRVFIPGNVKVLKGLWFDIGYTFTPDSAGIQAMCRAEGYAFAGCLLRYKYGTELLNLALKDIAERSGHPELVNCPMVTMGFSRNGSRSWDLAEEVPGRHLALLLGGNPGVCANFKIPTRVALAQSIPALTLAGSEDPFIGYQRKNTDLNWHLKDWLEIKAKPDLTWGMMRGWGYGHGWEGSWVALIPFVQEVHARRVAAPAQPDGTVALKPLPFSEGWLASYGWTGEWPEAAPVASFTGDKTKAIWLPGPETAHVWRAYQVEKPLAALTIAGNALGLDAVPADTTAVEYFDRSQSLGKATAAPFTVEAAGLAQGLRTVFAVLTVAGKTTATRPVTVIGGKPIDWRQAAVDWKKAEAPENLVRITPEQRALLRRILAKEAPAPGADEAKALRAAIEALLKSPWIEQRTSADKVLKKLDSAG